MGEEKHRSKPADLPPPFDPFETYKTPYGRTHTAEDEENPFIQFRRFADQQFSSFFSSLGDAIPGIFGHNVLPHQEDRGEWTEMYRRRQQMAEGWRKEWEQQVEEMRAETEKFRKELSAQLKTTQSSVDDAQRTSSDPRTELDMYRAHQEAGQVQKSPSRASDCTRNQGDGCEDSKQSAVSQQEEKSTTDTPWAPKWFTLGYDARWRASAKSVQERAAPSSKPFVLKPFSHDTGTSYRLDLADNPDHSLPWLLLNPYSPLYFCNPSQDRLVQAFFSWTPFGPLNVINPNFRPSAPSDLEHQLAKTLPWADAFEDLMSLHQMGKMQDRNYSTWRTPDDWIASMVGRGVLSGWVLDEEGRMVRDSNVRRKLSKEQVETYRKWYKGLRSKNAESRTSHVEEEANEWPSPMAVTEAIRKATETLQEPSAQPDVPQQVITQPADTSFSSSLDSSSWSSTEPNIQEGGSLISTMTTTERVVLPDGSIETKKVMKKRFADGREDTQESVERARAPKTPSLMDASKQLQPTLPAAMEVWSQNVPEKEVKAPSHDRSTQTTPAARQESVRKRGGWFWT